MEEMRTLELLAPAKNLECGLAAIEHGADAVYIGAAHFGARAAAGNSIDDIEQLCRYAHLFGARIFVTVNTIIYEQELADTKMLVKELARIGVDAVLIQDMGMVDIFCQVHAEEPELKLPALHASTQCDTRTAEKVKWLQSVGFERAVLARELSVAEIAAIHEQNPDMELEVFVHGALCVSYSGVCYASQHCFGRSANRGECAQFCRMKFDLVDATGREIEHQRYLLSLKDMCQIEQLEPLAEAGACSFKIEGRLKDVGYVKNVVSAYSKRLNQLVKKYPAKYRRASRGEVNYSFEPNLNKTFNRGFTNYFLDGRKPAIASFDTPKAMGEFVGTVKEIRHNSFNVAGTANFANGDGLCFINANRELEGFRVNRAEGNRLFPLKMPTHLKAGMRLYRNNDVVFEKILAGQTAERKIRINMSFSLTETGFALMADGKTVTVEFAHQEAQKPQRDNIVRQLTKLGNTPYTCDEVIVADEADRYFLPSSVLADMRRQLVELLSVADAPVMAVSAEKKAVKVANLVWTPEYKAYSYLYNVSNHLARQFYESQGMAGVGKAFEVAPKSDALIMQCRHCIRYSLGYCVKHGGRKPEWKEPLKLVLGDGRRFELEFNCKECQMNIYAE
uniref:U32 family peptidase n=1 Tax=Prevotella sp. GTC17262 TaxID=3236797 RepID=A0AB33JGM1_9BACT